MSTNCIVIVPETKTYQDSYFVYNFLLKTPNKMGISDKSLSNFESTVRSSDNKYYVFELNKKFQIFEIVEMWLPIIGFKYCILRKEELEKYGLKASY